MLSNTVARFLGIHCSLIKKHGFFVFLPNEGIFFAIHDVKEEGAGGGEGGGEGGGSDSNVILTLSVAT